MAAPVNCLVIEPMVETVDGVHGIPRSRSANPYPSARIGTPPCERTTEPAKPSFSSRVR